MRIVKPLPLADVETNELTEKRLKRQQYFHAAAAIANATGIYYLTRKLDFRMVPETVAMLEQHWRNLRLSERGA